MLYYNRVGVNCNQLREFSIYKCGALKRLPLMDFSERKAKCGKTEMTV